EIHASVAVEVSSLDVFRKVAPRQFQFERSVEPGARRMADVHHAEGALPAGVDRIAPAVAVQIEEIEIVVAIAGHRIGPADESGAAGLLLQDVHLVATPWHADDVGTAVAVDVA